MYRVKRILVIFFVLALVLLTACSNESGGDGENLSLKIGVMPAVDSAPILLAKENGYYEELGLDVEIQIYTNAMNRQSALQSGELDGAMTDVIALVNNVENGFAIKVTTSTDGSFPFLIHPEYDGKKEVKVGMMEVSVSNYLSDKSLMDYEVEKVYINEIPARLEMVATGNLDMAVIPEPMASQGALNGLKKEMIENDDAFSPDVMVFTDSAITEKEEALKLFHQAYNKAIQDINADDGPARDILIQTLELNPQIKENILMPEYHQARVPSKEFFQGILDWNQEVLGISIELDYEELVEDRFTHD
ncbi:ABC transporter substrate-binding protein [Alkalibacter rhizosphaerae]|uniref:ABC transporter substrate-binding protein n=1 Tax=Alkalibacter rhizosphaerae TaxID=2815577 RepID=A0A974XFS3_9FIRM|nr:ABC transporter substrate-binding protein [Alkalibacter rhizosphaerae]QSX09042.1 ABC transporter substrate-binding protein [Alkalibacter rhizosphaerae]